MRLLSTIVLAFLTWIGFAHNALAKPPLEAFGDAPAVRSASLSPDGKSIAYITRVDGMELLATYDVATGKNAAITRLPDARSGGLSWAGPNHIIIAASKFVRTPRYRRNYVDSNAFSYNLTTGKMVQLIIKTKDLFPYQTGFDEILAVSPDGQYAYMPAYMNGRRGDPTLDVLKVDLDTGLGERVPELRGGNNTVGWIIDGNAKPIARTEYTSKSNYYQIQVPGDSGSWRTIYSETSEDPKLGIVGLSPKPGTLIAVIEGNSDFLQMFEMSAADGTLTAPLRVRDDAELRGVFFDSSRTIIGVSYSGLYPRYELFDEQLNKDIKAASAAMPDAAVSIASASKDWSRILFYAAGGKQPPRYMLFDRAAKKLSQVAQERPEIKPEEIGEVATVEYKSRDGLTIPALVTWPTAIAPDQRKNLPLIVMPHGGPESYDSVDFNWLAQFLANEGYMVLQPNFRGSGGFGAAFAQAGYGEWGRKMQDDVTDGANAMFTMGWADPNRACIVGWSYGGYAALAGGALTPDLYKCVVAIAGVSDLRTMLADERKQRGATSSAYAYWKNVIGDPTKEGAAIEAVSPYRLANKFKAPVLLVHGSDDLVVSNQQSEMMESALKAAGKTVTYVAIGQDDHSLINDDSRRLMLTKLSEFLTKHIGK